MPVSRRAAESASTAALDPLGLFVIDPTCDCERRLPDNIPRAIGKGRQWANSPECSAALDQHPEVKRCTQKRFSPDEIGGGPTIRCHSSAPPEGEPCGGYTPRLLTTPASIHLFPGHPKCPRFDPKIGIGATIFHETLHSCGVLSESTAAELTRRCTGFDARL
jgi:hypothetical protein